MREPPPLQQQCSTPPPNGPPPNDQHAHVQQEEDEDTSSPSAASPASPEPQKARMHASADASAAPADAADVQQQQQTNAPAFWSTTTRHARSASYHSLAAHAAGGGQGPIQLEDHSEDQHEQSQGCWARSVTVDDYTVVSGTSGIGAYVVWHCTVRTLKGGDMNIRKRCVLCFLFLFNHRLIPFAVVFAAPMSQFRVLVIKVPTPHIPPKDPHHHATNTSPHLTLPPLPHPHNTP